MNKSDPLSFPSVPIEERITAPQLRSDRGPVATLEIVKQVVQSNREGLVLGRILVDDSVGLPNNVGRLLGEALIRGDTQAAEAVGLCWIYRYDRLCTPVKELIDTLRQQGRVDLVRPGVAILHDLCEGIWKKRLALSPHPGEDPTDLDQPFSAEYLPDLMRVSDEQYEAISHPALWHGASTTQGAEAWKQLGDDLTDQVRMGSGPGRGEALAPIILDIIQSIPDARAWTPTILLMLLQEHNSVLWHIPEWAALFEPLLDRLSDQEAPIMLGLLADADNALRRNVPLKDVGTRGYEKIEQLVHGLIDRHPSLGMDDWLRSDPSLSERITEDDSGLLELRIKVMEPLNTRNKTVYLNGSAKTIEVSDVLDIEPAEAIGTANGYDLMLGWLGPSRGGEMSQATVKGFERLLSLRDVQKLKLPILRSALDYWSLSQPAKQPKPETASPSVGRKRRI